VVLEGRLTGDAPSGASSSDQHRWIPRWSRADVQLIGRVGADPDIRFAVETGGGAWARFSVATEAPHGPDDVPDWHTVIVHDRLAQFVARYVSKGRLVHVVGWLTYRTSEGRTGGHKIAEISASNVLLLDRPTSRS
jgi:single-strand DNA-binding protein